MQSCGGVWTEETFPVPTLCTFIIVVDEKRCFVVAFCTRTCFPDVLFHLMKGEDKMP